MKKFAVAAVLFSASICFSQTQPKDRDTLPALLDEVHQLRQAIEGMTAASQRVQIALYGLQMQDAAVARATQRRDNARNQCSSLEQNRQHSAADVQRMESGLTSATTSESDLKEFKTRLPVLKNVLEAQTAELQSCQAAEAETSSQLKTEQAKLLELQDRIARLDKALEEIASRK